MHINLDGSVYCVDVRFFMPALPGKWDESLLVDGIVRHEPGSTHETPVGPKHPAYSQILVATSHEMNILNPLTAEDLAQIEEDMEGGD